MMKRKRQIPTGKASQPTTKLIGSVENIASHAEELLGRLPSGLKTKKAKKRALAKMILSEYSATKINPDEFKIIRNQSIKAPPQRSNMAPKVSKSLRMLETKHPRNSSNISKVEKVKYIAEAIFYDRNKTYSKSDGKNYNAIRRGKMVTQNGVRFTKNEINEAQTKYKHIYDRQIEKLTHQSVTGEGTGEKMLVRKLYEHLSLELNRQKGNQREERDL